MVSYDPYEDATMAVLENGDHHKITRDPKTMTTDDVDKNVVDDSRWENRPWNPACSPHLRIGTRPMDCAIRRAEYFHNHGITHFLTSTIFALYVKDTGEMITRCMEKSQL
jgi:hypothetical protein